MDVNCFSGGALVSKGVDCYTWLDAVRGGVLWSRCPYGAGIVEDYVNLGEVVYNDDGVLSCYGHVGNGWKNVRLLR